MKPLHYLRAAWKAGMLQTVPLKWRMIIKAGAQQDFQDQWQHWRHRSRLIGKKRDVTGPWRHGDRWIEGYT